MPAIATAIDNLTMGELRKLAAEALAAREGSTAGWEERGTCIVVLQRGWVYVGRLRVRGDECEIRDASCVRRWGTTLGLGQLAAEGPLPCTALEPCPRGVHYHRLTEVLAIPCVEAKWPR